MILPAFILTYLRVGAQEFKVALPLFMAKKKLEKGKRRSLRRKDNAVMCNTIDIAFTRLMSCNPLSNPSPISAVSASGHSSSSTSALGKGRHKGKGKSSPKGKGKSSVGFSGLPIHKGKGDYGQGQRISVSC